MTSGTLIILPNVLNPEETVGKEELPRCLDDMIGHLDGLICESEKSARVFLKRFTFPEGKSFRDIPLRLLNEHTDEKTHLKELLKPIQEGQTWGVISDCGLACFADPGSTLVAFAREKNIEVKAYVGPSSIILALLLSGFSAQSFSFHGYLPRDTEELKRKILDLKGLSEKFNQTQLFIEAPYRNDQMLKALLENLPSFFKICIAVDIGLKTQQIIVRDVKSMIKEKDSLSLHKRPALFLFSPK